MLLAEIHGKRCIEVENSEDYLTSAVFGHLRFVKDGAFWKAIFARAESVGASKTTLLDELYTQGIELGAECDFKVQFWPRFTTYGEPDLLLRFNGVGGRSLVLIIEVKLSSRKSGIQEDDQLKRYYDLLHDKKALNYWLYDDPMVALIYLTERYSADEVLESISCSNRELAESRIFPLQWQDLLEAARNLQPASDSILGEVVRFLERRGFERFRGFHTVLANFLGVSGYFYQTSYFQHMSLPLSNEGFQGSFYGE